ncbi:DUF1289 domain-containing protein [Pseudomonas segetis]
MSSEPQAAAPVRIESPCQRRCCLDDDDTCLGCGRTLDEIRAWNESDAQQRLAICQRASQRLLQANG